VTAIAPRERTAILQSIGAGVVPAVGLHHLQVGRKDEVEALIRDLQIIEEGGAAVRFIVGRYGSGKTFFLNLIRNVALQRKHVVLQADITTDRRLYATGGEARALYSELIRNLSTRARPEGNALPNLVEKWVGDLDHTVRTDGGSDDDIQKAIVKTLRPLQELVSGFDFATVMAKYYEGYRTHNEDLQASALRWLRGEYATKTEAREALGVRTIIDDAQVYDYLKLWAGFVRLAGYKGLLVNIDELVVLSHRLSNTISRNKNYEALLRIINDCLQGRAQGIAFTFAGTDECVEDRRRGLFSYEALATRLATNRFAVDGRQDWSSPVIKLQNLRPEDCFVLLGKLRFIHAGGDTSKYLIPDDGIAAYLRDCNDRMGAAYFQTPRDTVKDFVNLLNILDQDRTLSWESLMKTKAFVGPPSPTEDKTERADDRDLTEFKL
jgi:hypothetical protein